MAKVTGSPQYRLKVVPHRPLRSAIIAACAALTILLALLATYFFAQHRTAATLLSYDQGEALKAELAKAMHDYNELRQQLTKSQLNTEVDRQANEEIRQLTVTQRQQIAALERDIAVYRIMTSANNNNPKGISFGVLSVASLAGAEGAIGNQKQLKLVIQKLAEGDDEFTGELQFVVVGQRNGKEEKIPLHKLAQAREGVEPLAEVIPLSFKFFQNIETDLLIPEDFTPGRIELRVKSDSRRSPTLVDSQLEWPETK